MKKGFLLLVFSAVLAFSASAFEIFGTGNDGEESAAAVLTFMGQYLAQSGKEYEQQYQILQNALKQLETQARQLEAQIQEATGLDFGSITWGASDKIKGSSVYRDAKNAWDGLAQAGEKLQRMYNDIQSVWGSLEDAAVMVDGVAYSIADLANAGMPSVDFSSFGTAVAKNTQTKFGERADGWAKDLSKQEQEFIWKKYGMSPSDYYLTCQMRNQLNEMTARLTARTDSRLRDVQADRQAVNDAISQANIQLNEAGITDKQLSQISAKTLNTILYTLENLREITQDQITADVSKAYKESTREQAREESERYQRQAWGENLKTDSVPDYWKNSSSSIYSEGWKTSEEMNKKWLPF